MCNRVGAGVWPLGGSTIVCDGTMEAGPPCGFVQIQNQRFLFPSFCPDLTRTGLVRKFGNKTAACSRAQILSGKLGVVLSHCHRAPLPSSLSGRLCWCEAAGLARHMWHGVCCPQRPAALRDRRCSVSFSSACFRKSGSGCSHSPLGEEAMDHQGLSSWSVAVVWATHGRVASDRVAEP